MAKEPMDSEESAQGQSVRRRASVGIRRVTRDSLATSPTSGTTWTERGPAERMHRVPPEKGRRHLAAGREEVRRRGRVRRRWGRQCVCVRSLGEEHLLYHLDGSPPRAAASSVITAWN
ncbi:hypothetical protein HPB47_002542 [Ixodes persulcatus]|uniref:Uncharacterized protein n=1 Tax=Ixodes persulcatus TaxID=34615 RepID=A0AC60PL11_IXOPE|nr:hypothetical protein HPB47_002542 [Ixodes persulcatus]